MNKIIPLILAATVMTTSAEARHRHHRHHYRHHRVHVALAYAQTPQAGYFEMFNRHIHDTAASTLNIAQRYLGHGNPTGFRGPWCAAFANMVLRKAGARPSGSNLARSLLAVGPHVSNPQPGDLVVLSRGRGGHATFFKRWAGRGRLVGLGGNQGHSVRESEYPLHRVIAFVRPIH